MANFTQVVNPLDVRPNPSNGYVTVSGSFDDANAVCNIYDMTGSLVMSRNIALSPEFNLNLNALTSGMYIMEICGSKAVYHSKIMINK